MGTLRSLAKEKPTLPDNNKQVSLLERYKTVMSDLGFTVTYYVVRDGRHGLCTTFRCDKKEKNTEYVNFSKIIIGDLKEEIQLDTLEGEATKLVLTSGSYTGESTPKDAPSPWLPSPDELIEWINDVRKTKSYKQIVKNHSYKKITGDLLSLTESVMNSCGFILKEFTKYNAEEEVKYIKELTHNVVEGVKFSLRENVLSGVFVCDFKAFDLCPGTEFDLDERGWTCEENLSREIEKWIISVRHKRAKFYKLFGL